MIITEKDIANYKAKLKRRAERSLNAETETYLKNSTRNKTRQSIAKGEIVREPCLICGDTPTEAHHTNYNDYKSVVFLCRYHHTVLHYYKQLRETGKVASITQNCVRKYHQTYTKLHKY